MADVRWRKMLHRIAGDSLSIPVDNWRNVMAAGSTVGTPALEAVFSADWSNFGTTAGTGELVSYCRDPWGWVHLRGSAKKGVGITQDDTIFNLPVGYRPATAQGDVLGFVGYGRTGSTVGTTVYITVAPGGNVRTRNTTGNATRTFLDGVCFRAEDESV